MKVPNIKSSIIIHFIVGIGETQQPPIVYQTIGPIETPNHEDQEKKTLSGSCSRHICKKIQVRIRHRQGTQVAVETEFDNSDLIYSFSIN